MKKQNNYQIPLIITGLALILINRKSIKEVAQSMLFPLLNKINSGFGNRINPVTKQYKFHNGIDIAGKVGDRIKCPADGKIKSIFKNDIGGNQLIIEHDNGYTTGYAHLNKVYVSKGDPVKQGEFIAEVGNTGRVTGPHLHFTLKDFTGKYLNPIEFLKLKSI